MKQLLALPPPSFRPLRIYSDGAGTQSVAVMVLQAQGRLPNPFDVFVFANVGEDSENPETLAYRNEAVLPFAEKHGLPLIERQKMYKGKLDTVYEASVRADRSLPIPVKFPGQGFGNRKCTVDFKVEVVARYAKSEQHATHVHMGIGFSLEEGGRIYNKYPGWHDREWKRDKKTRQWKPGRKLGFWRLYDFPLAEMRLKRADCQAIIREAGLPPAPSSICWFCPFTPRRVWTERKTNKDPLYERGLQFEHDINVKYAAMRSTHPKASKFIGIHRDGIPLSQVGDQPTLWDDFADADESCEIGVCGV